MTNEQLLTKLLIISEAADNLFREQDTLNLLIILSINTCFQRILTARLQTRSQPFNFSGPY